MHVKISRLLSSVLLLGATAATAQSFPCASVAPEVRERVREAGACRDPKPADAPRTDATPSSSSTTVRLSDGTVVRVPREIGASIGGGSKRAAPNRNATRTGASPTQPALGTSADASPAQPSDRSAAGAAGTPPVTAPATASSAPITPDTVPSAPSTPALVAEAAPAAAAAAPVPASVSASVPASVPNVPPSTGSRFPTAASANAAFILGAGVVLGLLLGALLMRRWLLRRELVLEETAVRPIPFHIEQPADTGTAAVSETEPAPEIRFAARLEPGETTIVLAPVPEGSEVAIEQLSDHHA